MSFVSKLVAGLVALVALVVALVNGRFLLPFQPTPEGTRWANLRLGFDLDLANRGGVFRHLISFGWLVQLNPLRWGLQLTQREGDGVTDFYLVAGPFALYANLDADFSWPNLRAALNPFD